jgi:hypothetical protein
MHRYAIPFSTACLLLCLQPAMAAPEPDAPFPMEPVPVFAVLDSVATTDGVFGAAISSDKLDAQRGGADTVNNNMQLEGGVHGNVANHVVTGANSIDSGSFANMSGIPTVIQNSGANVLIQNATIINLQLK